MTYLFNVLMSMTRMLNAFLGGSVSESLSGRAWREGRTTLVKVIDALFFWQKNHCRMAHYEDRMLAKQFLER